MRSSDQGARHDTEATRGNCLGRCGPGAANRIIAGNWREAFPHSMDSIFKGDVNTARGGLLAWVDSLFVDHAVLRLVHINFGTVIPGRLYRCNRPTPMLLRRLTRRYGLTAVINLRGATGTGSYHPFRDPAEKLGLKNPDLSPASRGG